VTPSHLPAHTRSTPCATDTPAAVDSLVGLPTSATSVLLGSPVVSPKPPYISRTSCCSPKVSCVFGYPDQISHDEFPIPRLHVTSPPQPMLLLPRLLIAMMHMQFPFRVSLTVLLWFRVIVMLGFLSRAPVLLSCPPPPPLPLFALNLPCRLAAVADALSGMVNSDLLRLLPPGIPVAKSLPLFGCDCSHGPLPT
jgi:hypothetical protein